MISFPLMGLGSHFWQKSTLTAFLASILLDTEVLRFFYAVLIRSSSIVTYSHEWPWGRELMKNYSKNSNDFVFCYET